MLEGQTLDMEQYRAQKEELEREAMLRNPETAHLVSDEEFDRQLDELGWSPTDAASRLGMYVEVGMYKLEKSIRDAFRSLLELIFAAASLLIDTVRTFSWSCSPYWGLWRSPSACGTASSPRSGSGSRAISPSICGFR